MKIQIEPKTFIVDPKKEHKLNTAKRKDSILLLIYLNTYGDYDTAILKLRNHYLDKFFPLPNRWDKDYGNMSVYRSKFMTRYKQIYKDFIIQA
jgi:hypothetical protein